MAEEVKTAAAEGESGSKNFIDAFIEEDIAEGGRFQGQQVHTRFPPEPNGYLHIGHCKALTIDFGTAERFGGLCNLRMDDTNPTKEDVEFVDAIKEDIHWLGFDWGDRFFYGSDYFEKDYEYAVELIKKGLAYVCDLTPEQAREYRGDIGKPAISPYRDRDVEENLDLFERMKNGEFPEGSRTLRAKIDLASGNFNMRDPVIYRIRYMHHHRQGDKWCIYPMYDFAHPIQDALEGITHCTLLARIRGAPPALRLGRRAMFPCPISRARSSSPALASITRSCQSASSASLWRRASSPAGTIRVCRRCAACAAAASRLRPSATSATASALPRARAWSNTVSLSTACARTSTKRPSARWACCIR